MTFRSARSADLPQLVQMLADDPLGSGRENPQDLSGYEAALAAIAVDPNHQLVLACEGELVLGFLQLSFIPGLTYQGGWRAQIEGVRVLSQRRSQGLGRRLCEQAIQLARTRGCVLVQLTTDRARPEALRFYESLGFQASHLGLKLPLG